jgi:hypothetical protein
MLSVRVGKSNDHSIPVWPGSSGLFISFKWDFLKDQLQQ